MWNSSTSPFFSAYLYEAHSNVVYNLVTLLIPFQVWILPLLPLMVSVFSFGYHVKAGMILVVFRLDWEYT